MNPTVLKKMKNNYQTKNTIIIATCIASAVIFIFLLLLSFKSLPAKIYLTKIGTTIFTYNAVEQKQASHTEWKKLQETMPLYKNDTIKTNRLAEAHIHFFNETNAIIYKNSTITLTPETFTILTGSIKIDTTQQLSLQYNDATILIFPKTSLYFKALLNTDSFLIDIKKGSAKITTNNNKNFIESINQVAGKQKIINLKKQEFMLLPVNVKTPDHQQTIFSPTELTPIQFEWEHATTNIPIILEISKTKTFDTLHTKKILHDIYTSKIILPAGLWYWRIYEKNTLKSATIGSLNIIKTDKTQTITPMKDSIIQYTTLKPTINFLWTHDHIAKHWIFMLSNTPQFDTTLIKTTVDIPAFYTNNLESGTYYWKVIPQYGNTTSVPTSNISTFKIQNTNSFMPVELMLPRDNIELRVKKNHSKYYFSWKYNPEAVIYNFYIGKTTINNPRLVKQTNQTFVVVDIEDELLEQGEWSWAVDYYTRKETRSPLSQIKTFKIINNIADF